MVLTITSDDEGKRVVDADGTEIGRITAVENETAYVDPDPGITATVMSKLGWADKDKDTYPLEESNVVEITDDEILLG